MKYSNQLSLNVEDLIAQGMGPELHRFPVDVSTSRLAAALVGMANADGGTLPEQLRLAEAFVRENVRNVVRLVSFTHEETSEYPLAAVRELLVNAIVHRDYNVQGDNIHLNIFADRIEVHSPGGLPEPVNFGNLLEARFSRNAVIVQALSDLGYVERLGYGLNRVVEVVRQNGLQAPKFEEVAGTFRVTLYAELMQPAIDFPPQFEVLSGIRIKPPPTDGSELLGLAQANYKPRVPGIMS
jgi:predicted HTH transcriptional regulator